MSHEPTYLLAFFLTCFAIMSVACAYAGLTGFALNKTLVERFLSLGLGFLFAFGFARLSIETGGRIWA